MTGRTEIRVSDAPAFTLSYGTIKFLRDAWSVSEIKFLFLLRGWYWYLIRPFIFPVGMFYWLRTVAPDDPEAVRRVMAGAIVFGISLMMANMLAQLMIQDRFLGRLKLLITMPVSKGAYATGLLAFATMQVAPIVTLLLAFAWVAGVDYVLTWVFSPLIVLVLFSMAGPTLIIASYAPSAEVGSITANLFGIVLVLISPVFFTMERAPLVLQWFGWVSPMRYAADGIMKSLSGGTDVWRECAVLGGFAVGTMTLALCKLRWREH